MSSKPLVSILCPTFNHGKYIEQALQGFLMQKVTFGFEILIHDDASSDGTQEIIRKYQKKYPNIVKPILRKRNMHSTGERSIVGRFLLPKAQGEYTATCEGDDYWTNPYKLQKQVDFMEANKDYSLCFHPGRIIFENGEEPDSIYPDPSDGQKLTVGRLLKANFILTNSVMYRKREYKDLALDIMPGDWYLHLYHAQFGKIGFIDEVMSVYRRHSGGIWWDAYGDKDKFIKKYGESHLRLYQELLKIYGHNNKYKRTIIDNALHMLESIEGADSSASRQLLKDVIKRFPDFSYELLMKNLDNTERAKITVAENQLKINSLHKEIYKIRNSISWKATRPFRVLYRLISTGRWSP